MYNHYPPRNQWVFNIHTVHTAWYANQFWQFIWFCNYCEGFILLPTWSGLLCQSWLMIWLRSYNLFWISLPSVVSWLSSLHSIEDFEVEPRSSRLPCPRACLCPKLRWVGLSQFHQFRRGNPVPNTVEVLWLAQLLIWHSVALVSRKYWLEVKYLWRIKLLYVQ